MTDEEWEKQRSRAIMTAFQTGRPVFADTDGELRYTDGDRAQIPADIGQATGRALRRAQSAGTPSARHPVPRATALAARAHRASRRAFVASSVAAVANGIAGLWHPWQLAVAAGCVFCAVVWYRVGRRQLATLGCASAPDHGAEK